jgi:hypothetical protein
VSGGRLDAHVDLDAVDRDGALREARAGLTRADLLAGGATAAASAAVLALARPGRASAASRRDTAILRYALSLEYLQAAFYTEAERLGAMTGRPAEITRVLGGVERAHVRALRDLLGRQAPSRPRFDFQGATEDDEAFVRTAVAFEDLSVEAYKAQAVRIQDDRILTAAAGIHTVEARHAAWMRRLYRRPPAERAFDRPRDAQEVTRLVADTEFVVQEARRPRTERRRRSPRFTG